MVDIPPLLWLETEKPYFRKRDPDRVNEVRKVGDQITCFLKNNLHPSDKKSQNTSQASEQGNNVERADPAQVVQLWKHWDMVLGEELASLAIPFGRRRDRLLIGGEDSFILQELAMRTPEILERVNAFLDAPENAPYLTRVELSLPLGKRPLNQAPELSFSQKPQSPSMTCPPGLRGVYLASMRPDSPVTKFYKALLKTFGLLEQAQVTTIRWDLGSEEIEQESFCIIETECDYLRDKLPLEEWRVARRLIHTTGDVHIADRLSFCFKPIESALQAIQAHAPIFCDTNMVRSGISLPRLQKVNPTYKIEDIRCYIDDPDVKERSQREHLTRALCSVEKARPWLDGALVLIGNAPLALGRIVKYIQEDNIRPAVVIGMPVGFVNVVESKILLSQCKNIPQIVLEGRRGGSPLAVAAFHAILEERTSTTD